MRPSRNRFRVAAIPEIMEERGLTPGDFATLLGVTRQSVGSYLAGVSIPQLGTLLAMCEVFHKPLAFFVEPGGRQAAANEQSDDVQDREQKRVTA